MYMSDEQQKQQKLGNLNNLMLGLAHIAIHLNQTPGPREIGELEMSRAWQVVTDKDPLVLRDVALPLHLLTPVYFSRLVDLMLELQPDYVPAISNRAFSMRTGIGHSVLLQGLRDFSLRVGDGLYVCLGGSPQSPHARTYLEVWTLGMAAGDRVREVNLEVFGAHMPGACPDMRLMRPFMRASGFDLLVDAMDAGVITREALSISMSYLIGSMASLSVDKREAIIDMVNGWPVPLHDRGMYSGPSVVERGPKVRFMLCQHFGELFYSENSEKLHEMVVDALSSYSSLARFTVMEKNACPEELENAAAEVAAELGHVTRDVLNGHVPTYGYSGVFLQMRAQPGLIERMEAQHKTGWYANEVFMLLTVQEVIHIMVTDRLPLSAAEVPVTV